MSKSSLIINNQCVSCGSCLGFGYDFLSSDSSGKIHVKPGTMIDADSSEFKSLVEVCPVNAFEIDKGFCKEEVLEKLITELKNFKGVKKPTNKELEFNSNEYEIALPYAKGEYNYSYNSDSQAERAALNEFDRLMYSQIDVIILKIISEYRVKKVKPYYSVNTEDGSVYVICNKKLEEILTGIKNLLKDKLPQDFDQVKVLPDQKDIEWKALNKGEIISSELVSDVKDEYDYVASDYDCYWETDYQERIDGKNWRGEYKYKDKYAYMKMRNAFEELAKDLKNSCRYAKNHIEDAAVYHLDYIVTQYNAELEKVIKTKLNQIEQAR